RIERHGEPPPQQWREEYIKGDIPGFQQFGRAAATTACYPLYESARLRQFLLARATPTER
ncbi:MAG TPA: hypothetical protein VK624_02965, partial [Steroidobacteraceae bacterium]|nr:hypothetical protein [Steroidobacteraceae bacterium]